MLVVTEHVFTELHVLIGGALTGDLEHVTYRTRERQIRALQPRLTFPDTEQVGVRTMCKVVSSDIDYLHKTGSSKLDLRSSHLGDKC